MDPLVYNHSLRLLNIGDVEEDVNKEVVTYCMNDMKMDIKFLSKGEGGNVYTTRINGKTVIIKVTHDFNTDMAENIINEAKGCIMVNSLLKNSATPHGIYTYSMGWCVKNDSMMYIQEFTDGITLGKHFTDNPVSSIVLKSIVPQIAAFILALLINFGYYHGDLHANNIMVTKVREDTIIGYTLNGLKYSIPTYGLFVKIIDYGSFTKEGRDNINPFLTNIEEYKWMDDVKDEITHLRSKSSEYILSRYNTGIYSNNLSFVINMDKSTIDSTILLYEEYERKAIKNNDDAFERIKEQKRQKTIELNMVLSAVSDKTLEYILSIPKKYIPIFRAYSDYDSRQSLIYVITMELKRRGIRDIDPYKHLLEESSEPGYYYMDIALLQERLLQ